MSAERPRLRPENVIHALEEPDYDAGRTARKRIGKRTFIIRYDEYADEVFVRSVSATRRPLAS